MFVLPSSSCTPASGEGRCRRQILLVFDFPENLLEHVFHRDQAGDGAELVHHHGHVHAGFAGIQSTI